MRELMLELLSYEPYGKLRSEEEEYIREILSGNDNPPQTTLHDLFSGFYYCVQQRAFNDVNWLRQWKAAYGRAHLPLFFKKICFYLMVKGELSESVFMAQIGLHVSRLRKWGISPRFRKYAEADSYSIIRTFRNGVKKPYIVSLVKRLYYEAGRQESKFMILKKLPTFVDTFAGTASVAASMVSDGCPPPIVNDFDPVLVCFAYAFSHCQIELRKRIAEFHNDLMKQDFESTDWSYDAKAYQSHHDPQNLLTTPQIWDDPGTQSRLMEFFGYSKDDIEGGKMLAQRHQELVIRTRSSYKDVKNVLDLCDRNALRKINFNKLTPNQLEEVLDYALAMFYYYSFAPSGKTGNVYHETIVDVCSYFSYLSRLQVDLDAVRRTDQAVKAWTLTELQLKASSLTLESIGHFSEHLKGAKFYCRDFRSILPSGPSNKIFYLDSPYFLTVGYDVGFSDKDHKDMLDILRDAKFKWIFSMQYNPFDRSKCTSTSDEKKRRSQPHVIKDYDSYFRGFYAPFQLEADQRTYYVQTDAPMEDAKNLYVILFDFDKVKQKWPEMKTETREMLVVNFECLRMIPLRDSAVVLPFDLFLEYADNVKAYANAGKAYKKIVQKAIDWRRENITSEYTNESPV